MASVLAEAVGKVREMANGTDTALKLREDFESFKNRIEEINSSLSEDNEESTTDKESVRNWHQMVEDIVWEAQDILQKYDADSMYATDTQSCTLSCNQLILRHQMGRNSRRVKARMNSVVKEGNQLNISRAAVRHQIAAELQAVAVSEAAESSSGNQLAEPDKEAESANRSQEQKFNRWSLPPSDSEAVGKHSKIESMVSLLENSVIPIIAVLGCGGIGKTYLLQHVYNSIKGRYEVSVWLSVSQFYSVSELQRNLSFSAGENLFRRIKDTGSDEEAAQLIHEFLLGKRYVIVLDDVWGAAIEDDLLSRLGLPTEDNGESKILISTRSRDLCTNLRAHIYEMETLTDEESLRLLCAYAFPGCEGNRLPGHLKKVGLDIANQCGRLPLTLKTTGASLASNTLLIKWQSKLRELEKATTGSDRVMDILKLNYKSLPSQQLKTCFAYLSFSPGDEIIECEYLIYLWMAEGFTPTEENAWDCLDQLANLCLVEAWEDELLTKYCKLRHIVLELAICMSRENRCAFNVEDAFCKLHSVNTGGGHCCRLFLAKKDIDKHAISESRSISPKIVRTLSLSRNSEIGGNIPAMLFSGMTVLRVLDLSYTNISTLPACVGKMELLRVLNLRGTKIAKVPDCVRHLKSLCYLNVYHCSELGEAPKWISELRCLQHLEGPFNQMPNEISKLESLRTLRTSIRLNLSMEEDGMLRLEDVGRMREIEEIAIRLEHESQLQRMEEGILSPLKKLRRLDVENDIRGMRYPNLPEFPEKMIAMRDLEHLTLGNFGVRDWICSLANLRFLRFMGCEWIDYLELQAMPNLVTLFMSMSQNCRNFPKAFGQSGGFPHLRFLYIGSFSNLLEFPEIEEGAMARLENLELYFCRSLDKMGDGLQHLPRLKELSFCGSGTDKLRDSLKEGGEYWQKIKAINPHITILSVEI